MHYYPFHIKDYATATAHLSALEDLTYRRLIDLYCLDEKPISLDLKSVARKLRMALEDVETVVREFFTETPEGWSHGRCDNEILIYREVVERNRKNGKLGGRPKKTQSVSSGMPVGTHSEPSRNPLESQPRTKNQEPTLLDLEVQIEGVSSSRKRPRRPTEDEWRIYGRCLDPPFPDRDASRAWDYYEGNGWKTGKNPVKDWKACCRQCHSRWAEGPKQSTPQNNDIRRLF